MGISQEHSGILGCEKDLKTGVEYLASTVMMVASHVHGKSTCMFQRPVGGTLHVSAFLCILVGC